MHRANTVGPLSSHGHLRVEALLDSAASVGVVHLWVVALLNSTVGTYTVCSSLLRASSTKHVCAALLLLTAASRHVSVTVATRGGVVTLLIACADSMWHRPRPQECLGTLHMVAAGSCRFHGAKGAGQQIGPTSKPQPSPPPLRAPLSSRTHHIPLTSFSPFLARVLTQFPQISCTTVAVSAKFHSPSLEGLRLIREGEPLGPSSSSSWSLALSLLVFPCYCAKPATEPWLHAIATDGKAWPSVTTPSAHPRTHHRTLKAPTQGLACHRAAASA